MGDVSCDMCCHILIVCLEGVHTYTYASLLLWPSFCKSNCYVIRPSSTRRTVLLAINAPSFFKRGASQTMHFLDAPSSLSFCLGFDCFPASLPLQRSARGLHSATNGCTSSLLTVSAMAEELHFFMPFSPQLSPFLPPSRLC